MIGNGHTELQLFSGPHALSRLPVRFFRFSDTLRVLVASGEYRDLLGARVVRFGAMPAEDALRRIEPYLARDNPMEFMHQAPTTRASPAVLHALGATLQPDRGEITFALENGDEVRRTLPGVPALICLSRACAACPAPGRRSTPAESVVDPAAGRRPRVSADRCQRQHRWAADRRRGRGGVLKADAIPVSKLRSLLEYVGSAVDLLPLSLDGAELDVRPMLLASMTVREVSAAEPAVRSWHESGLHAARALTRKPAGSEPTRPQMASVADPGRFASARDAATRRTPRTSIRG